jgi:hypothetical protein
MKVKCPACSRICFETTDSFSPDLPPHGGMVRCLLQYQIDWLTSPTTPPSEMCCPECLAPLVVGGVLNVVMPIREAGEAFKDEKVIDGGQTIKTAVLRPDGGIQIPNPKTEEEKKAFNDLMDDFFVKPKTEFVCDVCGKECKNQFGLNSHKKSHKGGK